MAAASELSSSSSAALTASLPPSSGRRVHLPPRPGPSQPVVTQGEGKAALPDRAALLPSNAAAELTKDESTHSSAEYQQAFPASH